MITWHPCDDGQWHACEDSDEALCGAPVPAMHALTAPMYCCECIESLSLASDREADEDEEDDHVGEEEDE